MRRKLIIAIFLSAFVATIIPYSETVVPDWRIQLTYANGEPASGVEVRQFWTDASLEPNFVLHEDVENSDGDGYVSFPARKLSATLLQKGVGKVLSKVDFWSHSSYGRISHVSVDGYYQVVTYKEGEELIHSMTIYRVQETGSDR